ncbi:SLC13 family permease [Acetonema longum]|uniref:Dicarboxylate carrier MatC domain-containing protein n=1 Tax=Acetonema longum DSM 6540 TaxID=1009370 RepID=F7NHX9_9FIRM|nr:SLC13 family permease [Acetonema longum]EGO64358.1 dicarboxylate carrier MatC domain-containing protein [Acetonema longum DSM 6540]
MNLALFSLLAVILVFVIGSFRRNPLHIGLLGLLAAYLVGRMAGIPDAKLMGFFPTTLFVRVFGIMLFFGIAQANGSLELLAKKMMTKTGKNAKLLPFFIFYVGMILGSIGINSLAGMAILSGIGISLARAAGGNPLLFGIAGGYGVAAGCYSPINEYTANITAAAEMAKLPVQLAPIYAFNIVAFSISFLVIYLVLGGLKAKGQVDAELLKDLPSFNRNQIISMAGIFAVVALTILGIDVGWAGLIVAIACILLKTIDTVEVIKKVSLPSLILICGVGTLINLASYLKGFELMSGGLAAIMSSATVYPLLSFTSSLMSLFTISRLCVLTLVPTIPGILEAIPGISPQLAIASVAAGSFASSVGPLSANGALIMQNLGQQLGEQEAAKYFTTQMLMGVLGAVVIALVCYAGPILGIL